MDLMVISSIYISSSSECGSNLVTKYYHNLMTNYKSLYIVMNDSLIL